MALGHSLHHTDALSYLRESDKQYDGIFAWPHHRACSY